MNNIKSNIILKKIFEKLQQNKFLNVICYNKMFQNKLNIDKNDYEKYFKEYAKIEIEVECIYPLMFKANCINPSEKFYHHCHIYLNGKKDELNRKFISFYDSVTNAKIIIDSEIKTLSGLFKDCDRLKKINFVKFNRKDITDMSYMFYGCSALEKLNISNIKTKNVKNISYMFSNCSSLKELNLSSFNNSKLEEIKSIFFGCKSLERLYCDNKLIKNEFEINKKF